MNNTLIKSLSTNDSLTKNLMPTNSSSNSAILDLFFQIGAYRHRTDDEIIILFKAAFEENEITALKLLFYGRDIEKGLGERNFFRICLKWLAENNIEAIDKSINTIVLYKNIIRVDDIIWVINELLQKKFIGSMQVNFINNILRALLILTKDEKIGSIVAKWMPRKNSQYKRVVHYMRKTGLITTFSEYRRYISFKTNVVEQKMAAKDWENINLENCPSVALKKYRKAFERHNILEEYVQKVQAGEAKIHAQRLYPNDIVKTILQNYFGCNDNDNNLSQTSRALLDEQWKNLAKLEELPTEFRAIPIIDTSGSMTNPNLIPLSMSVGLGLFMAERNPNKDFKDYFITFSDSPTFQKITGHDIVEKVANARRADWTMTTNLEAVFELILNKAIKNKVPANEMPTHIVIISDMEFNRCNRDYSLSAMEMIRNQYAEAQYDLPTIVFWNVNGRQGNIPVKWDENNVLLISGASQNVINFVLRKTYSNLFALVEEVVNSERYNFIK